MFTVTHFFGNRQAVSGLYTPGEIGQIYGRDIQSTSDPLYVFWVNGKRVKTADPRDMTPFSVLHYVSIQRK